ncbi:hypothetical protein PR202_ga31085 [Eleusine coracana subsp. coracana]|uniref:Retrotransposon gag domain-containing protein n=1 Tax=Eleusine coracana subsp. coracana TaxID=191504 RepID=A0AAV5DS86_ELECO|nr:hypothetical protein PR202_ga31085 [Eleusine coracana subsp. coracana]
MKKSEADAWNAEKVKMDNELRQMMKRVLVRKGKSVAPIESEVVSQIYTMESLLDLAKPLSYEDFLSFERSLTEQENEELDEESALRIHRCRLYGEHDIATKYELKLQEEVEEAMCQQDVETDLQARRDESFPKVELQLAEDPAFIPRDLIHDDGRRAVPGGRTPKEINDEILQRQQNKTKKLLQGSTRLRQRMSTTGPSRTLRELSLPSPDVLVPHPSDEKATASSYVLNPIIISMAEANKFFGAKEEKPYTHLQDLVALCQTFHHEEVPRDLYRWLLFPFSLGGKAKEWHKAASREAKGKWSELVGNFCLHYFPLPKVQKLRREVVNFLQEDEESLTEAWTRFQTLLKQGPDLGIDENMCAQTFYMAIHKESRMHLDGSAGGSFLRLTTKVGIKLLGKIAENEALHKHWKEYLEPNRQCPEVMKKGESPAEQILMSETRSMITSGEFKEIEPVGLTSVGLTCAPIDAVYEPIGAATATGEAITLTTLPSSKEYTKIEAAILDNQLKEFKGNFAKLKGDRTLANAKPLDEFETMD